MAAVLAVRGSGVALAPQAQEPQAGPAWGQRGPEAIRPETGKPSRTPWGVRPSPWRWRCMSG